jgi:hypothetical protein
MLVEPRLERLEKKAGKIKEKEEGPEENLEVCG